MYYSYVEAEHFSLVFLANQNTPERPLAPVCSEIDTKDQLVWVSAPPAARSPLTAHPQLPQLRSLICRTPLGGHKGAPGGVSAKLKAPARNVSPSGSTLNFSSGT